ncbi:thioredoxin family protein [Sediminicola luteus]|uniref:Thiol-disulfide isomerase n=1 Tax=Sediminicola luteus TaxID=319238 RepID=A0A2A4G6R6_9FLAO|nr:thioredoxin family protein [Sediminicola luteus]PCE64337.1 thiol-disulfide isomerase [Sediminicola luteus]
MLRRLVFVVLLLFCGLATAQVWENDFDQAMKLAADQNKPLILVFAGSDWCAPCIRLEKEIWVNASFETYAKSNYVMYKADFPRKKSNRLAGHLQKKHASLAEKYNPKGYFPLVVILRDADRVLGTTTYKKMEVDSYIEHLNSFLR